MALPDSLTVVRVRGFVLNRDGTPSKKPLTFKPTVNVLVDTDGHELVTLESVRLFGDLDNGGYFQVELPATDCPGVTGFAWRYQVGSERSKAVSVPHGSPVVHFDDGDFPALWLSVAASTDLPVPPATYYTAAQTDAAIAAGGGSPTSGSFSPPTVQGDALSVTFSSDWGVDDDGNAYYDPSGAADGEAAQLSVGSDGAPVLTRFGG